MMKFNSVFDSLWGDQTVRKVLYSPLQPVRLWIGFLSACQGSRWCSGCPGVFCCPLPRFITTPPPPPPPLPLGISGSLRFNHTQLESLKRLWRVLSCPDIQRRKTRSFRVRQNFHSLTVLLDNKRTMSFFLSSSSLLISSNSDQNLGLGILTPNNQMRNLVWF